MDAFNFAFSLFGLILGLSVTESLAALPACCAIARKCGLAD